MYSNWGCAYANGFVVLAEGFHVLGIGADATSGKMRPRVICPFRKELRLDVWELNQGAESTCGVGELFSMSASMTAGGGP
jgi:hypothetical protein